MASNRSRRFRSLTGRIAEIDKQLGNISRTAQTVTDGLGEDAVSEDAILSGSVGSSAIQIQSITADKIAPSVFESSSSGVQRVPAPLSSTEYWQSAISGRVTAFAEAYFADKENKNVSVSASGITFSPEANTQVVVATAELMENGLVVLETRTAHGWEVGDYITVTNLGSPLDGEWVITDVQSSTTLCYTLSQYEEDISSVDVDAYVTYGGTNSTSDGEYFTIVRKSFIDGVVTLYLQNNPFSSSSNGDHDYEVGYVVTVSGLGTPYDGQQVVTAIPAESPNAFQYRIDTKTIDSFTPRIKLESAWGNGDFITYETKDYTTTTGEDSLHNISVNQFVEITGFTTTTGYNGVKKVSGVYGAGTTFTVDSAVVPAVDAAETGGTYWCYNAEVKAEADAVLFLTGKNPVPASRSVVVSWTSDNPINFYAVVWEASMPDFPMFLAIDSNLTESVSALSGVNNYLWEVPQEISHYAIYAEVLSGGNEVLLKECYVFESVGDVAKKVEKIVNASVASVANNANEVTFYTASSHSYAVDDAVVLSGIERISGALDNEFKVASVSADKKSFTVSIPVKQITVSTTSGSNLVYTTSTYNQETNLTSNLDISGSIFIGQPYTSSNTTALPNGTVTQILSSNVLTDIKTGLGATLTSGANTVTLASGNTTGMFLGQLLTKTSGTGAFGNSGVVYVTAVTGASTFTVDANHATSGAITFKSSEVSKLYDNFRVSNSSGGTNSSVTLSFYLSPTQANANTSLNASSMGGTSKNQNATLNPAGLTIASAQGQAVNLTDDKTDNYVAVYNADSVAVASISNVGAGTFKTLDADSLSVDNDITIGSEGISLVGEFASEQYNGKSYKGALLDRLARGTVYQASWLVPTSNIPSGIRNYGLAAGTFKLDSNRLYQVFVSSSGMRANPNAACAFEILFSTTPMRLADDVGLAHMAYVLPTQATSNISNNYWRDLVGHFYSISPTPVAANTTIFEISTWSRASGNANIVINVSNAAAGAYLQSNAANSTKMYVGINVNNSTYNSSINGTYELTKISNTQFRIVSASTTLISSQSGGTLTLVDPIMTNTQATFNRTSVVGTSDGTNHTYQIENLFQSGQLVDVVSSNSLWTVSGTIVSANANAFVINPQTASGTAAVSKTGLVATLSSGNTQVLLTTGNTSGLSNGQYLYKTSGTGAFGNSGNVYITSITNSTHFTVSTAHATSGSTTFNAVGALPAANTNTSTITADWSDKQVQLHKNYLPSQTDIYYILRLRHGAVTSGEYPIVIGENPNGLMAVTDLGQAKEITFAGQDAGWTDGLPPGYGLATTTETTVVTVTQTLNASDSAYYDNYGKGTGLTDPYAYRYSLYQGNPGTASGIKKSAVLFPSFTFNGTNGLTITKLEVYLRNRHSYKSSGLTAYIAAHKSTSLGTSVPLADDACPRVATTFTKGQGKWVELPSTWYSTFTSGGGGRGILLGVTDENPDTYYNGLDNYGYFDGYTMSDAPQFRITYQYNATVGSNNSSGGGGGSGGYVAV